MVLVGVFKLHWNWWNMCNVYISRSEIYIYIFQYKMWNIECLTNMCMCITMCMWMGFISNGTYAIFYLWNGTPILVINKRDCVPLTAVNNKLENFQHMHINLTLGSWQKRLVLKSPDRKQCIAFELYCVLICFNRVEQRTRYRVTQNRPTVLISAGKLNWRICFIASLVCVI